MKRFLMAGVIASASFAGLAQAATFTGVELSGSITSATYTEASSTITGALTDSNVYAFELEAQGGTWAVVSAPGAASNALTTGNFNFQAKPGYLITDIYIQAGGTYSLLAGSTFKATSNLTFFSGSPVTDQFSKTGAANGRWLLASSDTPFYNGVVAGTFSFDMNVTAPTAPPPASSTATGLNNTASSIYSAPTLFVTVAAVPEPGEWAMMLAGLSAVGLIARRRRAS